MKEKIYVGSICMIGVKGIDHMCGVSISCGQSDICMNHHRIIYHGPIKHFFINAQFLRKGKCQQMSKKH